MNPLFTLIAGVAVGVVGVRVAKSANTRKVLQSTAATGGETVRTGLNQAQSGLLDAAVSGLETIERTSAALRRKLNNTPPEEMPDTGPHEGSAAAGDADDSEVAS